MLSLSDCSFLFTPTWEITSIQYIYIHTPLYTYVYIHKYGIPWLCIPQVQSAALQLCLLVYSPWRVVQNHHDADSLWWTVHICFIVGLWWRGKSHELETRWHDRARSCTLENPFKVDVLGGGEKDYQRSHPKCGSSLNPIAYSNHIDHCAHILWNDSNIPALHRVCSRARAQCSAPSKTMDYF